MPETTTGGIQTVSGMITRSNAKGYCMQSDWGSVSSYRTMTVNAEHRHQVDLSGNTGYDGNSSYQEARPENLTYKIWVRTA